MVNTRPNKRHARGEANAPSARDTNARRAAGSACSGRSRRGRYRRRRMSKTAVRGRDRRRHGIGLHGSSGRFPQEALPGRVVRVTDGDGLVANVPGFGRLNVRLAYMDAPEHDQPWGPEATAALARLAVHLDIRLRLLYRDRYARAVAVVSAGDMVFNEELVRHGHAWVYPRYLPACQPASPAAQPLQRLGARRAAVKGWVVERPGSAGSALGVAPARGLWIACLVGEAPGPFLSGGCMML